MADEAPRKRRPMYKLRPYFVIRKVKLPDCMYMVRPLHKIPGLTDDNEDTKRALENLEYRQQQLFSRIKDLQQAVQSAGESAGIPAEELQALSEVHVPTSIPEDVVVVCSPSSPPYSLLALCQFINKKRPCRIRSFVDSSAAGRVRTELIDLFGGLASPGLLTKLTITVIWKDTQASKPRMIVKPNRQTEIEGITNISRYLSRQFCPDLYESLGLKTASSIDSWMDSISLSYLHGSAKEKASVLRRMNSDLGSSKFLTGAYPSLADLVAYGILSSQAGLKLGGNVKEWMARCHSQEEFSTIPCLYLKLT